MLQAPRLAAALAPPLRSSDLVPVAVGHSVGSVAL